MDRLFVVIVVLLGGCGRKGFSDEDAGTADAATPAGDALPIDAPLVCTDGDSVCLVGCVGMDSDCVTTCGDGTCVGNAGELCNSCTQDCATTTAVCGNGACDPGEQAAGCYADCGPSPWLWTAEEMQLVNLINTARTGGTKCPGPGGIMTAPALALEATLQMPAREWAWEIAHQNFWQMDGSACNGRTYQQRELIGGFAQYINSYNFADVQSAFNDWMSNQGLCNLVMDPTLTKMNVGVAFDLAKGYVFVIK